MALAPAPQYTAVVKRTLSIAAVLLLAVGLGVLVWQLSGKRRARTSEPSPQAEGDGNPATGAVRSDEQPRASGARAGQGAARTGEPAPGTEGSRAGDSSRPATAEGRGEPAGSTGDPAADRKYPPGSRPLAGAARQHLFPNAGMEDSKPLVANDPEGEEGDRSLHYVFRADRNAVTGNEPLTLTLAVYDGPPESGAKRVPARVIDAELRDSGPVVAVGIPLGKLAFNDEGRDGDAVARDLVHTCYFVPAEHSLYPDGGFYFAQVAFAVQGYPRTEAKVAFLHTPEERIPARFTGTFADRVEEGSLVVSAEVEVLRAGQFLLAANLYDRAGAPLARASNVLALEQGRRTVDLTFYGLILREANVDGPYVVRFFRGHRTLSGEFPNREEMPSFDGEHRTAPYDAREFSDVPWEDR